MFASTSTAASISSQHSSWLFHRPSSFVSRGRIDHLTPTLAKAATTVFVAASVSTSDFKVSHARNPRLVVTEALDQLSDPALFLDVVSSHLVPKSSVVSRAAAQTHRQVLLNVDRAAKWFTSLARRARAWHSEASEAHHRKHAAGHKERSAAASARSGEIKRLHSAAKEAEKQVCTLCHPSPYPCCGEIFSPC